MKNLDIFLHQLLLLLLIYPFGPVAFKFYLFTAKNQINRINSLLRSGSYPLLPETPRGMHGDLGASQAGLPHEKSINRYFLPFGLHCGIFAMKVLDLTAADQRKADRITNSSRRA